MEYILKKFITKKKINILNVHIKFLYFFYLFYKFIILHQIYIYNIFIDLHFLTKKMFLLFFYIYIYVNTILFIKKYIKNPKKFYIYNYNNNYIIELVTFLKIKYILYI